jgi:hypothetical protein
LRDRYVSHRTYNALPAEPVRDSRVLGCRRRRRRVRAGSGWVGRADPWRRIGRRIVGVAFGVGFGVGFWVGLGVHLGVDAAAASRLHALPIPDVVPFPSRPPPTLNFLFGASPAAGTAAWRACGSP